MIHHGENLNILKKIATESVDLIATDPPFNTGRDFGAYDDQWHNPRPSEYSTLRAYSSYVIDYIDFVNEWIDASLSNYLVFMGVRLEEMRRTLKLSGSIYLHCDSTASSYIKILMDLIFEKENYQNHIIWRRSSSKNDAVKRYGKTCDHIFFYSRISKLKYFERQFIESHNPSYIASQYTLDDKDGRGPYRTVPLEGHGSGGFYEYKGIEPGPWGWNVKKETLEKMDAENLLLFPKKTGGRLRKKVYLKDYKGVPISDLWTDIGMVQYHSDEYTEYPTQKPIEMYERMIRSSAPEGGVVLDPFCGSGTTLVAAAQSNRKYIGIDINEDAVNLAKSRLENLQPKLF